MKYLYAPIFVLCELLLFGQNISARQIADSLWLEEVRVTAGRIQVQDRYQPVQIT